MADLDLIECIKYTLYETGRTTAKKLHEVLRTKISREQLKCELLKLWYSGFVLRQIKKHKSGQKTMYWWMACDPSAVPINDVCLNFEHTVSKFGSVPSSFRHFFFKSKYMVQMIAHVIFTAGRTFTVKEIRKMLPYSDCFFNVDIGWCVNFLRETGRVDCEYRHHKVMHYMSLIRPKRPDKCEGWRPKY